MAIPVFGWGSGASILSRFAAQAAQAAVAAIAVGNYSSPDQLNETWVFGDDTLNSAAVSVLTPGYNNGTAQLLAGRPRHMAPSRRGTVPRFTIQHTNPSAFAEDIDYQLFINGAPVGAVATVPANSGALQILAIALSPTVEVDDLVSIRATAPALTAADVNPLVMVGFQPLAPGA